MAEEAISTNEARIRSLTRLYYSKPAIQQALLDFAKSREVVPRYFEGFGKRPDLLQYPADIQGLVQRGATSFHSSQELWRDVLQIDVDMKSSQLDDLREGWDLLIDIDSPYLDYSKIAARLVCEVLERYGITSFGIKFSGSKGFHIIVPCAAFPVIFEGKETRRMFPEWPRAITQYILQEIKNSYNREITQLGVDFSALERRTKMKKEDIVETRCPTCGNATRKSLIVFFECPRCHTPFVRPDVKPSARKLKCTNSLCSGFFEIKEQKDYFVCDHCKHNSFDKRNESFSEEFVEELAGDKLGSLDLVLVSSRHLFRMPYSLHEKTSLSSAVLMKSELANFSPKDADPLKVVVRPYYPVARPGEAIFLLERALQEKKSQELVEEKKHQSYKEFEKVNLSGVTDEMFPAPIKKLLKGLSEGRKRGLFILITFLKSLDFSPESITSRIYEWNKKNEPALKEGYVKSQLEWHLRQAKKILPPNYDNASFYKDLNLLDKPPTVKNPIVEVMRLLRKKNAQSL